MAYIILRTAKIKSRAELSSSAGHNYRQQPTVNSDSSRSKFNQHLFSNSREELKTRFEERYKAAESTAKKNGKSIRADAVLAIEYLITASPEAFCKEGFNESKYFSDALKFVQLKHGRENVIGASIHRDETTPHLVCYVVPIDQAGRLNCKSFLGGKKLLSQLQTDAHAAFGQPHGLVRGVVNSAAEHIPVKEFYKKVNSPSPAKPKPLAVVPDATLGERVLEAAGFETEHSKATEATLDKAKRQITVLQKSVEIQDAKIKIVELNKNNYERERRENSDFKEREKARAATLRTLPLIDVLARFGAAGNTKDKNNWDTEQGRITVTGSKFYNHDKTAGGGGAIDLIMHLHGCDYKQAVATLSDAFGTDCATAAVAANPRAAVASLVAANPIKSSLPADVPSNWGGVRKWLNSTRKIAIDVIDAFRRQNIIRADERGNAIFVNSEKTGGEIRGKGANYKGYRGERGLVIYTENVDKKTCVVVESGTDAMAFAMHPKSAGVGLIASVGGDFGRKTIDQLQALQDKGYQLICGTDNDESGDKKYKLMRKELEVGGKVILREKPLGRDWQDDIKSPAFTHNKVNKVNQKDDEKDDEKLAIKM